MGGTGKKFTEATTIVAGIASLVATLLSIISIWLQIKNYRKPLLQRYVVRILVMVPIYSITSWISMVSLDAASWFAPIRDIYEAFTIYTFFQLLINYMGGERALIMLSHGREPVHHVWPMNHLLPRVDISDPHTFLAIKRGILQYAWLKPILALAAIIMKATHTYQEGYIGLNSGYFWSGIIYNISVTVSLYSLGLFWVCMHNDLKPFRPIPKFLSIKLIIFASYWQGFFLSILVWLGALPDDVQGYTPDNLAAAIQDALICIEMPAFAITHWYAFSWHDYKDSRYTQGRMPIYHALRDAFGIVDLIQDSKETFRGDTYKYRMFDSGDKVMAHEASRQRLARLKDGMRYERGGKGKYWIPKPGEASSTTPLLSSNGGPSRISDLGSDLSLDEAFLDAEEDAFYDKAKLLQFGDWNYPVIACDSDEEHHLSSQQQPAYQRPSLAVSHAAVTRSMEQHQQIRRPARPAEPEVVIPKKKVKQKQKSALKSAQTGESLADPAPTARSNAGTSTPPQRAYPPRTVHFTPPHPDSDPSMEETHHWSSSQPEMEREERQSPQYVAGDDDDEFGNVWGR